VTLRIVEWFFYCPADFRVKIADFTVTFAHRVAYWTERNWKITSPSDLNSYIYAAAVLVGINWAEIFNFYDGTKINYGLLEIFTRAHQGINILLDREKDLKRGVSFWPPGWTET
jgi:farnesyl-diphosphate farnesyltransferase